LATAATAFTEDPIALTGTWKTQQNIAGNESSSDCTFTQKDTDLSGSCVSERGKVEITGKVDGKKVTWSYKSEYNGNPLTVIYNGTIESATKIAGTVSVPEYSVDGEFTATQTK
jgi:hypothetical protein